MGKVEELIKQYRHIRYLRKPAYQRTKKSEELRAKARELEAQISKIREELERINSESRGIEYKNVLEYESETEQKILDFLNDKTETLE